MKKSSREINIFGMSALDLFASALGAFILIAIILFPYFPNTGDSPERVAEVRAELAQVQQELQQTEAELQQTQADLRECRSEVEQLLDQLQQSQSSLQTCRSELEQIQEDLQQVQSSLPACRSQLAQAEAQLDSCQAELKRRFLLIIASWSTRDDVDLHIIDPEGREYYYDARSFSGSPANLEEDNITGPGNEIWLHPTATQGDYRILYKLFSNRSGSGVTVRGSMLTPEGKTSFPHRTLSREGDKVDIVTVRVDDDGYASIIRN